MNKEECGVNVGAKSNSPNLPNFSITPASSIDPVSEAST